ncbi:MAG: hypothetical protein J0L76_10070 [Rhodobacterales bacterium]|nr:hypothetical protein [Rhodobacterales bacterium]
MIDAHQHFWQLGRGDYDWPNASVAPIFRDFGPHDLAPLLAAAGVGQTVLVQANRHRKVNLSPWPACDIAA